MSVAGGGGHCVAFHKGSRSNLGYDQSSPNYSPRLHPRSAYTPANILLLECPRPRNA